VDPKRFTDVVTGRVVRTIQGYHAFVPAAPPETLPLDPATELALSRADAALGELSGLGRYPTRRLTSR
jgi:hypothetical protein